MPFRRQLYHPKWSLISYLIRNVRAQGRCEECGVQNGTVVRRLGKGRYIKATGCELLQVAYRQTFTKTNGRKYTQWDALRYYGLTRIITTTSHLDRNPKNNRFSNLQAKCQRCHLLYDMPEHVRNRSYGIDHAGEHQLKVFQSIK